MEAEKILKIIKNNLVFIISFSVMLILYIAYLCYQMYQDYQKEKKNRKLISACPDYWTKTKDGCQWPDYMNLTMASACTKLGKLTEVQTSCKMNEKLLDFDNSKWGLSTKQAYKNKCSWLKNNKVSWDTLEAALC